VLRRQARSCHCPPNRSVDRDFRDAPIPINRRRCPRLSDGERRPNGDLSLRAQAAHCPAPARRAGTSAVPNPSAPLWGEAVYNFRLAIQPGVGEEYAYHFEVRHEGPRRYLLVRECEGLLRPVDPTDPLAPTPFGRIISHIVHLTQEAASGVHVRMVSLDK
jgi:hypothetical protein